MIHSRRPAPLTDKDTIVLAEFTNTTGDPVFDDTLRQGLAAQLQQSPFLSLVSDDRIRKTLALMQQPPDARLTSEIAQGVCVRTASAAVLDGSIGSSPRKTSYREALRLAGSARLQDARRTSAIGAAIAKQSRRLERAALFETATALWEALYGNAAAARQKVATTLSLGRGRDVDYAAAFALGRGR